MINENHIKSSIIASMSLGKAIIKSDYPLNWWKNKENNTEIKWDAPISLMPTIVNFVIDAFDGFSVAYSNIKNWQVSYKIEWVQDGYSHTYFLKTLDAKNKKDAEEIIETLMKNATIDDYKTITSESVKNNIIKILTSEGRIHGI